MLTLFFFIVSRKVVFLWAACRVGVAWRMVMSAVVLRVVRILLIANALYL